MEREDLKWEKLLKDKDASDMLIKKYYYNWVWFQIK